MTVAKDWMQEAANEIGDNVRYGSGNDEEYRDIIAKHCPFKDGVAYTPVVEPPLLICVDCRNTESPAGAMARHFNHGRCLHCGGYFKVLRA